MPPATEVTDEPRVLRSAAAVCWALGGVTLLSWAFLLYGFSDTYPLLAVVEVAAGAMGIGVIVAAFTAPSGLPPRWFRLLTVVGSIGMLVLWSWIQVRIAPAYGTDESAFDQFAAQLVAHGHDPYGVSMAPSFPLFHVSPNGFTFRLDGTPVTTLSYPALSFLAYVPFVLLGMTTQVAIAVNVAAWALGVLLAYRLLSTELKPLALVVGSLAVYTGFAVGGVTDALYIPLLLVAVYRWDQLGTTTGWRRVAAPVAMGLACSIKQTPWLVFGVLVVSLVLEGVLAGSVRSRWRRAGRYSLEVVGTFLVVNVVFILAAPSAFLKGITTPFAGQVVPAGQGWIALSNFLGLGGANLEEYSVLLVAVGLVTLAAYVALYPRSKPAAVIVPSVVLFFASRSFASYLVMLVLPAIVAATSVRVETGVPMLLRRLDRKVLVVGMGGAAAVLLGALVVVTSSTQPIEVQIDSVQTTGQLATIIRTTVSATNRTGAVVHPVFSIEDGGAITAPWNVVTGPDALGPGQGATYVLEAPNFFAQPSLGVGFQVVALTTSPAAMSVSSPYVPTQWHVNLDPAAVNHPVPVGVPTTFSAEVLDQLNRPIRRAGIAVYLGQVTYAQSGLQFSQAVINHGQIGQTPIEATTNGEGIATFTVTGTTPGLDPVYVEANLVNQVASYPYGYSDIVPIRYVN